MAGTFNNQGDEAIERQLDVNEDNCSFTKNNIDELYEIKKCCQWVMDGKYEKVALQFPDELLQFAPAVCRLIQQNLRFPVFILADTTFGSCCVDEVAAEHVGTDAVIHFGRTCLSPSYRLPVLYILAPYYTMDLHKIEISLNEAISDKSSLLILTYDTRCSYEIEKLHQRLLPEFPNLLISELIFPNNLWENVKKTSECTPLRDDQMKSCNCVTNSCDQLKTCECVTINNDKNSFDDNLTIEFNGRSVTLPNGHDIKDYGFIYIGQNTSTLTCIAMRFSQSIFYQIEPDTGNCVNVSKAKNVMNRSGKLEQVKDANIIGIIIGTLGKFKYMDIVKRLKALIKYSGKKSYTFVVGKPNEPKLGNMPGIDVFIHVACPETSITERSHDAALYKKLVTPWEVEVALNPSQEWSMQFETDFQRLLPGGRLYKEFNETDVDRDLEVSVSLLTNKTQCMGIRSNESQSLDGISGTVAVKPEGSLAKLHYGGGGEVLTQQSWTGLDPTLSPQHPIDTIIEGLHGIASGYKSEISNENLCNIEPL